MNDALVRLASEIRLNDAENERMRFEFGYACALRVKHLLEEPEVVECLHALTQFLDQAIDRPRLDEVARRANVLANQHEGSRSIDGCGHAAVSGSYAVANALAGKPLQAADYAAYAMVYGQGGYGAVADRESFQAEFQWQVSCLTSLARQEALRRSSSTSGAKHGRGT